MQLSIILYKDKQSLSLVNPHTPVENSPYSIHPPPHIHIHTHQKGPQAPIAIGMRLWGRLIAPDYDDTFTFLTCTSLCGVVNNLLAL